MLDEVFRVAVVLGNSSSWLSMKESMAPRNHQFPRKAALPPTPERPTLGFAKVPGYPHCHNPPTYAGCHSITCVSLCAYLVVHSFVMSTDSSAHCCSHRTKFLHRNIRPTLHQKMKPELWVPAEASRAPTGKPEMRLGRLA